MACSFFPWAWRAAHWCHSARDACRGLPRTIPAHSFSMSAEASAGRFSATRISLLGPAPGSGGGAGGWVSGEWNVAARRARDLRGAYRRLLLDHRLCILAPGNRARRQNPRVVITVDRYSLRAGTLWEWSLHAMTLHARDSCLAPSPVVECSRGNVHDMATTALLTGGDLLEMKEDVNRHELVRGELVEVTPPGISHGRRSVRIGRLLDEFVEDSDLGMVGVESGFYLERDPDTVRGPDVWFISRHRLDPDADVEGFSDIVPDLAVEVVSPGDTYAEVTDKVDEYLRAGVRMVWVVDPRFHKVTLYPGGQILSEPDTLTGGEVLPGFSVPVSRLFGRRR